MKISVDNLSIDVTESEIITSGSYGHICEVALSDDFDGLTTRLFCGNEFVPIIDNKATLPMLNAGSVVLGVYGYELDDDQKYKLVVSPKPIRISVKKGSFSNSLVEYEQATATDIEYIKTQFVNCVKYDDLNDYAKTTYVDNGLATKQDKGDYATTSDLETKQDILVSGTNIKTINNESLLGSGNITIQGGSGSSDYEDLSNKPQINSVELDGNKSLDELGIQASGDYALKSDIKTYTSGDNIVVDNANKINFAYYINKSTSTWKVDDFDIPTNLAIDNRISKNYATKGELKAKQDAVATSNIIDGASITVADNIEYYGTDILTLTLTYPSTNFECYFSFSIASEGTISIEIPQSKYIGTIPTFTNGKSYEISIKNGVVIIAEVSESES